MFASSSRCCLSFRVADVRSNFSCRWSVSGKPSRLLNRDAFFRASSRKVWKAKVATFFSDAASFDETSVEYFQSAISLLLASMGARWLKCFRKSFTSLLASTSESCVKATKHRTENIVRKTATRSQTKCHRDWMTQRRSKLRCKLINFFPSNV